MHPTDGYRDEPQRTDGWWWTRGGEVFENVGRAGIFADLGSHDVAALTQQLRPVTFPRGHTIVFQGQPAERLYIIETGKVKSPS